MVSYNLFGEHIDSKFKFIKKWFIFDRFINVKNKGIFDNTIDYMIDDREFVLDEFKIAKTIKINTTLEKNKSKHQIASWCEIPNIIGV